MNFWIQNYIAAVVIAIVMVALMIPNILTISFRKKLFDSVDSRKIHVGSVPRLGGISFLPSIGISFCVVVGAGIRFGSTGLPESLALMAVPLLFLICCLLLTYLVGIADDLMGMRYRSKFLFQIIIGMLLVCGGWTIGNLYGFCEIKEMPEWIGWALTVFVVIYILNAMNLIDGIDGLSSGLSIVALIWYSWVFYDVSNYICFLMAGAMLGALIPFSYFNIFGKAKRRTKIFMGDTGSLTVGLVLTFLVIAIFQAPPECARECKGLFVIAVMPLVVPCFDVVRVFIHRVKIGYNPFMSDKSHIHHKLLAVGMNQTQTLLTILSFDIFIIALNLLLLWQSMSSTLIIIIDIAIWTVGNMILTRMIRRREKQLNTTLYR